jgi:hypothetical protein
LRQVNPTPRRPAAQDQLAAHQPVAPLKIVHHFRIELPGQGKFVESGVIPDSSRLPQRQSVARRGIL